MDKVSQIMGLFKFVDDSLRYCIQCMKISLFNIFLYLNLFKYWIPWVVNLRDLRKMCFLLVKDSIIVLRNSSAILFLFISLVLKKFLLLMINKQAIFSKTLCAKLFHLFSCKYLWILNLICYLKLKQNFTSIMENMLIFSVSKTKQSGNYFDNKRHV